MRKLYAALASIVIGTIVTAMYLLHLMETTDINFDIDLGDDI